ncbi:uncharacterized protein LOC111254101 [Varroa destructor]|uniref:Uncharacterized protein n=1 Tax=Varroa destructor TaxID=109461 RepID=A0A7M7KQA5_VARDE|nr:uncharacterized protein LOC111254101 [Varroa destructor]XP_022670346.1 uncharacterized protein LOC111254101 [Varroa destructor]XP_022670347.1 uncharacterized protein LOC111254101 [Varroa destructor]
MAASAIAPLQLEYLESASVRRTSSKLKLRMRKTRGTAVQAIEKVSSTLKAFEGDIQWTHPLLLVRCLAHSQSRSASWVVLCFVYLSVFRSGMLIPRCKDSMRDQLITLWHLLPGKNIAQMRWSAKTEIGRLLQQDLYTRADGSYNLSGKLPFLEAVDDVAAWAVAPVCLS